MCGIQLQRQSEIPIKRQIYQALRDQILNGRLKSEEALPSTRELASRLNVSRNTVCEAYDMLISEGFAISRQGAPTRVADGLWLDSITKCTPALVEKKEFHYSADFQTGRPDLRRFPQFAWNQILHNTAAELPLKLLGYSGPQGLPALRQEIAAWLFRSKGLDVDDRDIFITSGATQALHVIAGILSDRGETIAIEDPCNKGILLTFLNAGCDVQPIPVDENGIQPEYLHKSDACAIYVTPSHQFPLGGILPASRRASLIRFAQEHNIYLVEDDYDSEFRYAGEPISPLYAMEPQRVIYVGTFSKVLFPAIRIGYVILPRQLQQTWCELRTHTDVQNAIFEQAALAEFLHTRKFDRHIRMMRKLYGERRTVLLDTLKETFGDTWRVWGDSAGLHVAVEFFDRCFDDSFLSKCRQNGIRIASIEQHSIRKGYHQNMLLLGYGHLEPKEIRDGILKLLSVIHPVSVLL